MIAKGINNDKEERMQSRHQSAGHTEPWESISSTQEATLNRGSPYPQLEGPHRSVGVRIPISRGPTEAWESPAPTRGATPKRGSPYPHLEGPH